MSIMQFDFPICHIFYRNEHFIIDIISSQEHATFMRSNEQLGIRKTIYNQRQVEELHTR